MKKLGTVMLFLLALALILAIGCAPAPPRSIILRNPTTGESVWVRQSYYYGIGLAAAIANVDAQNRQRDDIEAAIQMGYTEWAIPK